MKPGDRIEVYEITGLDPMIRYLYGKQFASVENDPEGVWSSHEDAQGFNGEYFRFDEVKPIGCLIIKTVK